MPTSASNYSPSDNRTTSFEISPAKILRRVDCLAQLKRGEAPPVLNVEVYVSESCNAKCAGCLAPLHRNVNMTPTLARVTSVLLQSWGTEAVVLTGGGEPTCCPDFEEVVDIFARDFKVGAYSNGISPRIVKAAEKLTWLFVSLDAADADSWQKYKGVSKGMFQQVLDNIYDAAKLTEVGVGFLVGKHNQHDINRMAFMGESSSADYVLFRPLWTPGMEPLGTDTKMALSEAQGNYPKVRVAWDKFNDQAKWSRPYSTCWYSMFGRVIGADGSIYACPSAWPKRKLGHVSRGLKLAAPLPVTDECRTMCRGHGICKLVDYVMSEGGDDKSFV